MLCSTTLSTLTSDSEHKIHLQPNTSALLTSCSLETQLQELRRTINMESTQEILLVLARTELIFFAMRGWSLELGGLVQVVIQHP